jgi:hypothetical protein
MLYVSGVLAWRPAPHRVVTATTNRGTGAPGARLAVDLAPVRVDAISPGIVDSLAWDGLGDGKDAFLRSVADRNPGRGVGTVDDLAPCRRVRSDEPRS